MVPLRPLHHSDVPQHHGSLCRLQGVRVGADSTDLDKRLEGPFLVAGHPPRRPNGQQDRDPGRRLEGALSFVRAPGRIQGLERCLLVAGGAFGGAHAREEATAGRGAPGADVQGQLQAVLQHGSGAVEQTHLSQQPAEQVAEPRRGLAVELARGQEPADRALARRDEPRLHLPRDHRLNSGQADALCQQLGIVLLAWGTLNVHVAHRGPGPGNGRAADARELARELRGPGGWHDHRELTPLGPQRQSDAHLSEAAGALQVLRAVPRRDQCEDLADASHARLDLLPKFADVHLWARPRISWSAWPSAMLVVAHAAYPDISPPCREPGLPAILRQGLGDLADGRLRRAAQQMRRAAGVVVAPEQVDVGGSHLAVPLAPGAPRVREHHGGLQVAEAGGPALQTGGPDLLQQGRRQVVHAQAPQLQICGRSDASGHRRSGSCLRLHQLALRPRLPALARRLLVPSDATRARAQILGRNRRKHLRRDRLHGFGLLGDSRLQRAELLIQRLALHAAHVQVGLSLLLRLEKGVLDQRLLLRQPGLELGDAARRALRLVRRGVALLREHRPELLDLRLQDLHTLVGLRARGQQQRLLVAQACPQRGDLVGTCLRFHRLRSALFLQHALDLLGFSFVSTAPLLLLGLGLTQSDLGTEHLVCQLLFQVRHDSLLPLHFCDQ
mmetsp:Transcript_4721/g.17845  ORF Transcript_4721/g.17845 Transcript_4721/m.17845 type:complete len:671 (+) Transcript_4721:685-2697(+)